MTHRSTLPLDSDFDDLVSNLFGLDSSALIGLEYRFGLIRNGQVGIHRTSGKTIEFFAQYGLLRQARSPIDVSLFGTLDGTNNFRDSYSPAVGIILSRTIRDRVALYLEPVWVNNSNALPREVVDDNDTLMVGVGARIRISSTAYLAAEIVPRTENSPGVTHGSAALEKRVGGHFFQLNVSNALGTTMAQIAQGGPQQNNWYLGFNISRKFF